MRRNPIHSFIPHAPPLTDIQLHERIVLGDDAFVYALVMRGRASGVDFEP
jgi:hypothetical protein